MTGRMQKNEHANAEILGVVILIGIFAIMAGIISATTLASPAPVKVPAASIEITNSSEASLRFAHNGGDPIPLESLFVLRTKADGSSDPLLPAAGWLGITDRPTVENGFVNAAISNTYAAITLIWQPSTGGSSVIASWDPSGIYGPLGPPGLGGNSTSGAPNVPHIQPTISPMPVAWSSENEVTANFTPYDGSVVPAGEWFTFDDRSTGDITLWSWNFGDGTTFEGTTPGEHVPHRYEYRGSYLATLTVSNPGTGAYNTVTHAIKVEPGYGEIPPVDFIIAPRSTGNRELTVTCTATTSSAINATAWQWETIDGVNGTTTPFGPFYGDLMHASSRSQDFTFLNLAGSINNTCSIKFTVWSPYLVDPITVTKTVTVGPPLKASFMPNVTVGIATFPIRFIDTSAGVVETWLWDFGDGTPTSNVQHPDHVFTVPGNYTVTLTITGFDQTLPGTPPGTHIVTDTTTRTIGVEDPVKADFTANRTEGQPPFTVQFNDTSTGDPTNWTWSFGDGGTSNLRNPIHTYTTEGSFTVGLVAEKLDPDSADPMVKLHYINVGPPVVVAFNATPTSGLVPLSVQFTDLSSGNPDNWTWSFGDGMTSHERNPLHVYSNVGSYDVTLTAANPYRNGTLKKTECVDVLDQVIANFTGTPLQVPVNRPVSLTDLSTGSPTIWSWDFGDGQTSTEQSPSHSYARAGTYTVTLNASHAYSANTKTQTAYVNVFFPATAGFYATPLEVQAPNTVTFTDTSTGIPDTWRWEFGDGTTSTAQNPPPHLYTGARNYRVNLTVWNSQWPDLTSTTSTTIRAYAPLVASFTADMVAGAAPLWVNFTDTSTGNPYSWTWVFGDTTPNSGGQNVMHKYDTPGNYTVTLVVRNPTGSSTTSRNIMVFGPPVAAFVGTPRTVNRDVNVRFTDLSTNSPTTWVWDFGDGATSNVQNPVHAYNKKGWYDVKLTAGNSAGQNSITIANYIQVT